LKKKNGRKQFMPSGYSENGGKTASPTTGEGAIPQYANRGKYLSA
jgi:hypothetical protein